MKKRRKAKDPKAIKPTQHGLTGYKYHRCRCSICRDKALPLARKFNQSNYRSYKPYRRGMKIEEGSKVRLYWSEGKRKTGHRRVATVVHVLENHHVRIDVPHGGKHVWSLIGQYVKIL